MYRELRILIAAVREYKLTRNGSIDWLTLDDFGFKKLGAGCYGAAFSHPDWSDRVYKVGFDTSDPYLGFAVYAQQHKHVVCLPKMHGIYMTKDFYVVEMEKLTPLTHEESYGDYKLIKDAGNKGRAAYFAYEYPEINDMYSRLGRPDDLHFGNIMKCGEQLVMTDPYTPNGVDQRINKYMPDKVDNHEIKHFSMAEFRARVSSRAQAEDQALRAVAQYDDQQRVERLAGVLPPMQRVGLGAEALANYNRAAVEILREEHEQRFAALRLQNRVDCGGASKHVGSNMVIGRRADLIVADSLQHRMVQKVRPMRPASVHREWVARRGPPSFTTRTAAQVPDRKLTPGEIGLLEQAGKGKPKAFRAQV